MAAFVVVGPAITAAQEAPPDRPQCARVYHVPEYRALAKRVYRFTKLGARPQLRLFHMRQCAVHRKALRAMQRITLRQRMARRHRQARLCGSATCNRELGRYMAIRRYGTIDAFNCIDGIVMGESAWRHRVNYGGYEGPYQGRAYGIPQALPGSKMSSAGADWETNPATQIRWMFGYVDSVYGGPCNALAVKRSRGWY